MNANQQPALQGSVLLMSVFILLAIVSSAMTMATLVRLQILQARNEDNALKARYVAESGLERGLDLLSSHRLQTQTTSPTNLAGTLSLISGLTGTLYNGQGTYVFDSSRTIETVSSIKFQLDELASKQIDLFDVDNPYSVNPYPMESFSVDWVEGESCPAGTSEVQVTVTQFDLNGSAVDTTPQELVVPCGSFAAQPDFDCRLESNALVSPNNYVIRIKAKTCDLAFGEFFVYSTDGASAGDEQSLASHAVLTVNGSLGSTQSSMQASAPWRAAPSGFIDYVLFVEGDLVK